MQYNIKEILDWPMIPKGIVIVIVCLILLYFGYFFDFSDQAAKLHRLELQEQDLKMQYTALAENLNTIHAELTAYPLLTAALKASQAKTVSSENLPELLNDILKIARQNDLVVNQFNPQPETKEANYSHVKINAALVGAFNQIANFMGQVANMDTTVGIGDFTLSKPKPTAAEQVVNSSLLNLDLALDIYEVKKA